ncbi:Ig-like domain-containing protein [Candidatus Bipolaricaulota bacterium]
MTYAEVGRRKTRRGLGATRFASLISIILILASLGALAAQPVITGVSIPNVSMKISDIVTATISVQSDSATVYTLNASTIGGYALGSLSKQNSTTYTATFTIASGGTDYAAGANIPTSVTLADGGLTDTWSTAISQASDPIDANRPTLTSAAFTDAALKVGETSPATFTFSEAVSGFSNGDLTIPNGTLTPVSSGDGGTTWTATFTPTDDLEDVTNAITVAMTGVTDAATNAGEGTADSSNYAIDTKEPTVTNVTPSDTWITESDAGGAFTITVDFSEAMDTGATPSITFSPDISSTLTLVSDEWPAAGSDEQYIATYSVTDSNVDADEIWTDVEDCADAAGNAQENFTAVDDFMIDTVKPTITGISTNDALITDVDTPGDAAFVVTIEFSEAMNTGIAPTVSFDPAVGTTLTLDGTSGWLDSDTYEAKYDTADGTVDHDNVQIDATGTQDAAGNGQENYTPQNEFGIDTVNPTVTGVAVDDTLLADSDEGTTLTVTVDFSEAMIDDGSTDPTLTFNPAVGSTLAIASDSWPTSSRYQAIYDISDADVDVDSVTIDVTLAKDEAGNDQEDYTPVSEFAIDTLNPTVTSLVISDSLITDADVGDTFTVTIDYSEPMFAGTAPTIVFSPNLNTTLSFQAGSSSWTDTDTYIASYTILDGNVAVLDDDITVSAAQDLALNVQVVYNYNDQLDVDTENPVFASFTVDGGLVDANCEIDIAFSVRVTDLNRSITAGNVSLIDVTIPTSNATEGASSITSQTQDGVTAVDAVGTVAVSDLTSCPANVRVVLEATDDAGNATQATVTGANITDEIVPVINDLKFNTDNTYAVEQTVPYLVDECGLVVVYFSANVTDNCCIVPGNVNVSVTLPTDNAILESIVVSRVQNGQGRVDVTGNAVVRCLDGPTMSRVQVDISTADCCGNPAVSDATGTGEGLVDDIILPIPRNDPRQDMVMDESAVIDPLVEVRLDEFGTYRLVLRESTPVRIDLMGNDADNLTHNVAHPFGPCVVCGPCGGQTGCCATMVIHEIVEHPSYGTASVEDGEGDCNGGTVIRYAPDRGYLGPDYFTYRIRDAFGNVSSVIATVYLQVVPEVWMEDVFVIACTGETVEFSVSAADLFIDPDDPEIILFGFSITDGPEHGVVGGSLLDVVYTPPSTITDPQFGVQVPSLDFSEAAAVVLTYTPADGFSGIDQLRIRFEDPFGGVAIAVVDIAVGQCMNAAAQSTIHVVQGQLLPLIVPISFASVFDAGLGTVTLLSLQDGILYQEAIAAEWSEEINRHVLTINTAGLPLGSYELKMPLGTGEVVTLTIEVGEAT